MHNLIYILIIPALLMLALVGRRMIKNELRHYAQDRRPLLLQPAQTKKGEPLRLVIWALDRPDATKTVLTVPPNRTTVSLELDGLAVWYVPGASKSLFICSSVQDGSTRVTDLTLDKETRTEINGEIFCCYPTAAASNKEAFAKASA